VLGLTSANFTVAQEMMPMLPSTARPILNFGFNVAKPVATVAVLDHSKSLTDQPVAFADMKSGFSTFYDSLRANDEGEIIKFDDVVEVVQGFTSSKSALQASIAAPYDKGNNTRLYDAIFKAIDDAATKTTFRRAVVVATDGEDLGDTIPYSIKTKDQVIANAIQKNVPVFTIGLGANIRRDVLTDIAVNTGGLFYEANTSQNLATIYKQLSSLLYENQYVLTFDQLGGRGSGALSNVVITATQPPLTPGTGQRQIASCN
jgi:hypothetical protein